MPDQIFDANKEASGTKTDASSLLHDTIDKTQVIVLSADLLKKKLEQEAVDGESAEMTEMITSCANEISRSVRSYVTRNVSKDDWNAVCSETKD